MKNSIIVAFHIGRGGRFNNPGHVTFIGEKNFQDLIKMNSNELFEKDRQNGKFCRKHFTDLNGTVIVDADDVNNLVGTLEFDGQYDTDSACFIGDCSEETLRLIADSDVFKSAELEDYLKTNIND